MIEVTESALTQDGETLLCSLTELRALGVRISIDDFGTGYSSLHRLRRLPITELKIDRSFIDEIESFGEHAPVVAAIVAMGKALGLEIVAEGVEKSAQLHALSRLGCDHAQGYLFSRPLPVPELYELLGGAAPFEAVFSDIGQPVITEIEAGLMDLIGSAARGAGTLETTVRPLLVELERVTGLESTYLTRIDWDANVQEIIFARNVGELAITEGLTVDWEDTLCRRVLLGGPSATDNVPADYPDNETARSLGLQSFATATVLAPDGTVWGTLCGASARPQPIDDDARRALELFARLIADRMFRSVEARSP